MALTDLKTGSKSGLLFLLLSLALAVTVHVGLTSPSRDLLEEQRDLRQDLEARHAEAAARRDELIVRSRALRVDVFALEREMRRRGLAAKGEEIVTARTGR